MSSIELRHGSNVQVCTTCFRFEEVIGLLRRYSFDLHDASFPSRPAASCLTLCISYLLLMSQVHKAKHGLRPRAHQGRHPPNVALTLVPQPFLLTHPLKPCCDS